MQIDRSRNRGTDTHLITIQSISGIPNAKRASGPTPESMVKLRIVEVTPPPRGLI
jgi:hypothetical protein